MGRVGWVAMSQGRPTLASVSDPGQLLRLLIGIYDAAVIGSGVRNLRRPTAETLEDPQAMLILMTGLMGAAYVMGHVNIPRPTSGSISTPERLLPLLMKLYEAVGMP